MSNQDEVDFDEADDNSYDNRSNSKGRKEEEGEATNKSSKKIIPGDGLDPNILFISRFAHNIYKPEVANLFGKYGKILNIVLRGKIAFVEFDSAEDAYKAKNGLHLAPGLGSDSLIVDYKKESFNMNLHGGRDEADFPPRSSKGARGVIDLKTGTVKKLEHGDSHRRSDDRDPPPKSYRDEPIYRDERYDDRRDDRPPRYAEPPPHDYYPVRGIPPYARPHKGEIDYDMYRPPAGAKPFPPREYRDEYPPHRPVGPPGPRPMYDERYYDRPPIKVPIGREFEELPPPRGRYLPVDPYYGYPHDPHHGPPIYDSRRAPPREELYPPNVARVDKRPRHADPSEYEERPINPRHKGPPPAGYDHPPPRFVRDGPPIAPAIPISEDKFVYPNVHYSSSRKEGQQTSSSTAAHDKRYMESAEEYYRHRRGSRGSGDEDNNYDYEDAKDGSKYGAEDDESVDEAVKKSLSAPRSRGGTGSKSKGHGKP
eukprot:gene12107-16204_t